MKSSRATPGTIAWHERLAGLGILAKGALLCGALTVALVLALAIAWAMPHPQAVSAAIAAWAICLVAGINGLAVAELLRSRLARVSPFHGLLAGMLVRMGMPLALLVIMVTTSHPLLDAGFAHYLIAFYQVMLFVEVILIVPRASTMAFQGRRGDDASTETTR